MKKTATIIFTVFFIHLGFAQYEKIDSLKKILPAAKDTTRANILNELSGLYLSIPVTDTGRGFLSAQYYAGEALTLSRNIHYGKGIGQALYNEAIILDGTPLKKSEAIQIYQQALSYLEKSGDPHAVATGMQRLAESLHTIGKLDQAILYFDSVTHIVQGFGDTVWSVYSLTMKGHCYFDMGDYRLAYQYGTAALKLAESTKIPQSQEDPLAHLANLYLGAGLPAISLNYLHRLFELDSVHLYPVNKVWSGNAWWGLLRAGEAYLQEGLLDSAILISKILSEAEADGDNKLFYGHLYLALHEYHKALDCFTIGFNQEKKSDHEIGAARHANELGKTYLTLRNFDSARIYANEALARAQKIHALLEMRNAVGTLNDIYAQTKDYARVYRYSQWYKSLNDSLAPEEYKQKLALVEVQTALETQRQQALLLNKDLQIKEQQLSREALIKKLFIAGIVLLLFIAGFIFRNNKLKQKANNLLNRQKEEIQSTLTELKSVQAQLIQSAKMASLGELTAGIAHEIQNPLNFVNNFSDLNAELIEEMKTELLAGDNARALFIAEDISGNEKKINQHGKRAELIVKGMLQHSRSNSGLKEPADINLLTEESLRLSYHGFCTKIKAFSARIDTSFDGGIDKFDIVPQDISRVLINLFNNAFYALNEKKKEEGDAFQPAIHVVTKKMSDGVEIRVKDNGGGISHSLADKIFQPFFTTKPTGQGTGLGLSISYDIVNAHAGKLELISTAGEGAEFILYLPFNTVMK